MARNDLIGPKTGTTHDNVVRNDDAPPDLALDTSIASEPTGTWSRALTADGFTHNPMLQCWETRVWFREDDVDGQVDTQAGGPIDTPGDTPADAQADMPAGSTADAPPHELLATPPAALAKLDRHWRFIERGLLSRLHDLYNDLWRDPTVDTALTEREFLDSITLESIDISNRGTLALTFADAELFGGQWIQIQWHPDGSLDVDLWE